MKRILKIIMVLICLFPLLFITAAAEEGGEAVEESEMYTELYSQSGAADLYGELPQKTRDILKSAGIEEVSSEGLMSLSVVDIISGTIEAFKSGISAPATLFCTSIGIILLCALLNSMNITFLQSSTGGMLSAVCVLALSAVMIMPVSALMSQVKETVSAAAAFTLTFLPIYTGVAASSGLTMSAALSNGTLLVAVEAVSMVADSVLVPMLSIYLALCLIGSATDAIDISSIANAVQKTVTISLSFLLSIFVGLLIVQGNIAASADSISIRTAKFAAGSFLPVVGSAVSDAMASLQGCMSLLKSVTGSFGIIAIAAVFLPMLISLGIMRAMVGLSAAIASMLGVVRIDKLLKAIGSVLSLLISISVTYALLIIISLTVITSASGGAA